MSHSTYKTNGVYDHHSDVIWYRVDHSIYHLQEKRASIMGEAPLSYLKKDGHECYVGMTKDAYKGSHIQIAKSVSGRTFYTISIRCL